MHEDIGTTLLGSFTSLETPIFLTLLVPTGLIVYWAYYKNFQAIRRVGGGSNPLATMLKHAYFFDDLYYDLAKGIGKFSDGLMHIDDSANLLLNSFVAWFVRASSKLKKVPSTTVQNYLAAGIVGFILIVVLIILTVGVL
jgi:hypothetical protein